MSSTSEYLSPIEEIIEDAAAGRMFILVDDENRENEGDLVIAAEFADAEAINFMAKYGRGLICLAMDKKQVKRLQLPRMAQHNSSRHETAFTISIEAREGVTTGISAADRARTIEVAIDPNSTQADIASPGHVFPLEAREGGVLVRAGHTEAAVDISRMAGLNPSGVICEIMNDDGTMARLPDLIKFAQKHRLKIATIADLIEYRRRREKLVERTLESSFTSKCGGEFKLILYTSKLAYAEHVVLIKGDIHSDKDASEPVLVRMHALDIMQDVLLDADNPKTGELHAAMQQISRVGRGVVVLLRTPKRDILSSRLKNDSSNRQSSTSSGGGGVYDVRDYGIGAQILLDIGVKNMKLLTNSNPQMVGLEGYGLNIVGYEPISNS